MGVVVFAKVQGLVRSESPRTFVKNTAFIRIYFGLALVSNIPDKNSKSIEIFQKCCENRLAKKKFEWEILLLSKYDQKLGC